MTVKPGNTAPPSLPAAFVEAFDGLLAGTVSLEFARRRLLAALDQDITCGTAMQALVEQAYEETRLSDEDYEALNGELTRALSEDLPTDWSEETSGVHESLAASAGSPAGNLTRHLERASNPLYPGAVLRERFVLQARIGTGSVAEVYKALDRRRQESGAREPIVAVKAVSPSFPDHARAIAILQHEAAVGQRLQHPNIRRVLDFDRDGEHAFLTMEWVDGESLAELLGRLRYRPVHSGRARKIVEDIGNALCHAHGQGITHGDVKPGNILLPTGGAAKLLDFGAAREPADSEAGADGNSGMTPAYSSCEVLEGLAATRQDDLFSLACVAYRMLAGRRAFGRLSALEAEKAGRRPARIPHVTAGQWAALDHALAFRRSGRHVDIPAFLREFRGPPESAAPAPAVTAPGVSSPPPGLTLRPRRIAAGLVVATLVVFAAVNLSRTPGPTATAKLSNASPAVAAPAPERGSGATPAPSRVAVTAAAPAPAGQRDVRSRKTEVSTLVKPVAARPERKRGAGGAGAAPGDARSVAVGPPTAELLNPARSESAPVATPAAAPAPAGTTDSATVPLSELKFTRYVEPEEPQRLRSSREGGWVVVSFRVDEEGRTADVEVTDSNPKGRYDTTALNAVRRWRFEPPRVNGRPVTRQTTVRLRFQP